MRFLLWMMAQPDTFYDRQHSDPAAAAAAADGPMTAEDPPIVRDPPVGLEREPEPEPPPDPEPPPLAPLAASPAGAPLS